MYFKLNVFGFLLGEASPNGRVRYGQLIERGSPSRMGSVGRKGPYAGSESLELEYIKEHTKALYYSTCIT